MQRQWIKMAGLLLLAVVAADAAAAQADYPNSPVRLISDSGPGSAADTGLRIVADGMSHYWTSPYDHSLRFSCTTSIHAPRTR